jgi:VanZ family protein
LRYPWLWLALGWALVIGVVAGTLMPAPLLRDLSLDDKLLHAGSYCLLMIWFAGLYRRARHVIIAAILLALGAALDVLQIGTATRSFDPRDIVANALGILLGLLLSLWLLEGWCQRLERRLLAIGS